MRTYGVIIEGGYDEAALTEIIRKCLPTQVEIIPRRCGGKGVLMKKFRNYLELFRHEKQGSHVDKVFIIRDADCKDSEELKRNMESKIADRKYPFVVKFIVIVQELEAWLLADEEAVSRITQSQSRKSVLRVNEPLESISQPKQILRGILSEAQVSYTEAVAREIAQESDLDKIGYRCPRFKEFRQAVIDC